MSYKVPSLDDAHRFLISFWKALFPLSAVMSKFSYHWKRLRAYAAVSGDLHDHISVAQDDVMPDSSTGAFLDRWLEINGLERKGATGARKANALRVMGTIATAVPYLSQWTHTPTGFQYVVTEAGAVIGAQKYVDVDVAALGDTADVGAATRLLSGEQLTLNTPVAGITNQAKLVLDLDEDGFDQEQDAAASPRMLQVMGSPRMGGSTDDFVKWALSVSGVSYAYAYANRAGLGSMDVAALHTGSGTARSLTVGEAATLLAYIQSQAAANITATGGALRILTTIVETQNVEIAISTNGDPAYAFDWIDSPALVVLAYTPATRALQFTTAVPSTMVAGGRFVVRGVGSVQDASILTVDSISAADTVIVRETAAVNFAATDQVYAGGPLTQIIRDAIIGHMSGEIVYADTGKPVRASVAGSTAVSRKLRQLAEGIGTSNPSGQYGTWNGSLLRSIVGSIANYPTGVRNVSVVTPAVDQDSTDYAFPNDQQIGFMGPGSVLIRKA